MKFAYLLYEGMTALDLIGPHEVLCRVPNAQTLRVAKRAGPVRTDSGMMLTADLSFAEVREADVLVTPGASSATSMADDPVTLDWIRRIHASSQWTASICTGSLILGAAGLLVGRRATCHWAAHSRLAQYGAIPVHERVVEDGKLMTGAGVVAGIDMALTLVDRIAGARLAQTLQLAVEYDPKPPFDCGHPGKAPPEMVASLQARMSAAFSEPEATAPLAAPAVQA